MMNYKTLLLSIILCLGFSSCFNEEKFNNSRRDNFEALWKVLDERYCFFEYKNVDWDDVYTRYSSRISEEMTSDALFSVFAEMLSELRDGHVNLVARHDVARYWKWHEDFPDNFDEKIIRKPRYLGTDYGIASGLKYKILNDNVGYIYYADFSSGLGEGNLNEVLRRMLTCDGIIIDVRNNGGGYLTNSEKLASHFVREKTLVGYIKHKTGKGHNDFSKPYAKYVEPSGISFLKTVVVLTNRKCYSSTNDFVGAMKYAYNAVTMGDKTGGGSGLPFSSEIPNGWSVRFSASPMLDVGMQHTEFGIDPDIPVEMTDEDMRNGIDTIIERARQYIDEQKEL